MEELHQVTLQYLSCADPIEAAARRQQIMHADAQGQTEEVAGTVVG